MKVCNRVSSTVEPLVQGDTGSTPVPGPIKNRKIRMGIAIDLKTNEWVEQGRLSDDDLESIYREGSSNEGCAGWIWILLVLGLLTSIGLLLST